MKRVFVLSAFICFGIISACQKEDSAAEAQLAQRKAELDKREQALDEREKALVRRERAGSNQRTITPGVQSRQPADLEAEREKRLQQLPPELRALISDHSHMDPANIARERETRHRQTPDPGQAEAERQRRIQQLPPELQALIRDRSLLDSRSAKGAGTEDRAAELKRRLEEARRNNVGAMASPNLEGSDAQATSPSPSPTPQ